MRLRGHRKNIVHVLKVGGFKKLSTQTYIGKFEKHINLLSNRMVNIFTGRLDPGKLILRPFINLSRADKRKKIMLELLPVGKVHSLIKIFS